jgi:hypothetical protein
MPEDDWRLTWEEDWMYGAQLERRRFEAPSPDWDHEHCVLCQDKFMEPPSEALHEGLVHGYDRSRQAPSLERRLRTHRDAPEAFSTSVEAPAQKEWICETCFSDFEARFRWTASEAASSS